MKGDGKAGRWFTPLELHVLPKLGKVPVQEIDQRDIRDVLAPIWRTKAGTARKAVNTLPTTCTSDAGQRSLASAFPLPSSLPAQAGLISAMRFRDHWPRQNPASPVMGKAPFDQLHDWLDL